jgi:hypothetical protein
VAVKVAVCNAKDCGARMIWVRTINGGRAPLDAEPVEVVLDKDVVLVKRGEADEPLALSIAHIGDEEVIEKLSMQGVAFYRDHHATCTSLDDFRDHPL